MRDLNSQLLEDDLFVKQSINETTSGDHGELSREFKALIEKLRGSSLPPALINSLEAGQKALEKNDKVKVQKSLETFVQNREELEALVRESGVPALNQLVEATRPEFIDDERRSKIVPWRRLDPDSFILNREKIGDHEIKDTLKLLELYGISLLRISGQYPNEEILRGYFELIGQVAKSQNDFTEEIKTILPKPEISPNTGDSAQDLGFHVDGTQAFDQPSLLAFQYVKTADFGGNSRFLDLAGVMKQLPNRDEILVNLAKSDAASFDKKGMQHVGPIFCFPDGHSLAGRLRFDSVIEVNKECTEAFGILQDAIYAGSEIKFRPHPGDIIIFDNWRVMHARSDIFGDAQRIHRRVWMNALNTEHQGKFLQGIRPLSSEVAAQIEARNAEKAS